MAKSKLAVLQLLHELGLITRIQVHAGIGLLFHVLGHQPRQQRYPVGEAHAHGDVGGEVLVDGGDLGGHDPFHIGHVLSELHGHLARLGKRDARRGAVDERSAELLFDAGNFLRQARARHVKLVCRL